MKHVLVLCVSIVCTCKGWHVFRGTGEETMLGGKAEVGSQPGIGVNIVKPDRTKGGSLLIKLHQTQWD